MEKTIEQFLIDHLYSNGLFEDQARKVLEIFKQEDAVKSLRMGDRCAAYPSFMLPVLIISVNRAAVEWIDKELPNHWARPMFDPKMRTELEAVKSDPDFNAIVGRATVAVDAVPTNLPQAVTIIDPPNADFDHADIHPTDRYWLDLEINNDKLYAPNEKFLLFSQFYKKVPDLGHRFPPPERNGEKRDC